MAVITFTANAKPTQFYKPYKNTNTVENIQPKKYLIESVSVNLSNKVNAPSFFNPRSNRRAVFAESEK